MRQETAFPNVVQEVTLTSFPTTATAADDTVTVTSNTKLQDGDEVVLTLDGGDAAGLTTATTYYIVRVSATSVKLATTRANATAATPVVVNITGDAGAGDVYPVYGLANLTGYDDGLDSAGLLYVGSTGNLSIKGANGGMSGASFPSAVAFPVGLTEIRVGAIHSYLATATGIQIWSWS